MKHTKSTIPKKMRKEMETDPDYKTCSLYGQEGHICGGRITREHALIVAGRSVQQPWAIIPLCARGHAVDEWQDAGTMNKEMNEWAALNRATDLDICLLFGEVTSNPLAKSWRLFQRKNFLNTKYGEYKRNFPVKLLIEKIKPMQPEVKSRQFWYPVPDSQKVIVQKAIKHFKEVEDVHYTPFQMIERMVVEFGQNLENLEEENRM